MGKKTKHFSSVEDFVKKGNGIAGIATSLLKGVLKTTPLENLLNQAIDALPIELHLPGGYNYCGPGTKLKERLKRGDRGINKLDEACKEHDISYSKHSDSESRSIADRVLAEKAWQRLKSSDASLGERAASLAVATAMKAKTAVGGGRKKRKNRNNRKVKRGGGKKRRCSKTSRKREQRKTSKNGGGLYLRPYRTAY